MPEMSGMLRIENEKREKRENEKGAAWVYKIRNILEKNVSIRKLGHIHNMTP